MKTEVKLGLGLGALLIAIIGAAYVFMPAPVQTATNLETPTPSTPVPETPEVITPTTMPATMPTIETPSTMPSFTVTPSTMPSMTVGPATMPSMAGGMTPGTAGGTGGGTGPSGPVDWNALLAGSTTGGTTSGGSMSGGSSSGNTMSGGSMASGTRTGMLPPSVSGLGSNIPGSSLPRLGGSSSSSSSGLTGATPATYTIKAGDTLGSISTNLFGSPNYWSKIAQANPGVNSNRLKVGQVIKIPDEQEVKPAASAVARTEKVSGSALVRDPKSEYQVVAGDSLEKISTKLYGTPNRWKDIFNLNKAKMGRPNNLKVCQTLKLPAAPSGTTRPS